MKHQLSRFFPEQKTKKYFVFRHLCPKQSFDRLFHLSVSTNGKLFFIKTYHIYHEKSDQKYDGVDPSLQSNHLDYEVERRFGWGWQDWRTLLGKPSTFWTFNFTIFGNLTHRWMWAKPHMGTQQTLGFLKDAREREREKKKQSLSQQEQKNDKSSTDLRLVQTTVTSRK